MGTVSTLAGAAAHLSTPQRVVIVGAGPSGMGMAIELAQRGIRSVVLEARGPVGSREPLFNVIPAFADRIASADPSGGLARRLVPTSHIDTRNYATAADAMSGRIPTAQIRRQFSGVVQADATRSHGDMAAVTAALLDPRHRHADTRTWSKIGIGDLDTAMREHVRATPALREMIDLRFDAPVDRIRQGNGWAEAVLGTAPQGAADSVRGAMLIDASGRNLLGSPFSIHPEKTSWLGARFEPGAGAAATQAMPIHRAYTPGLTHADRTVTVALPTHDRTVVWAEVSGEQVGSSVDEQLALIRGRARLTGVKEPLVAGAKPWPVDVQLAYTTRAADGRMLAIGNSVRSPYFMTSTGAASALVHDVPHAADAVEAVLFHGADPSQVSAGYDSAVRGANDVLHKPVGRMLAQDAGIDRAHIGEPVVGEWPPRR
jgi:2-polyprenyl-6-methoxyphenol hydroxylase-like FAD-dependent oxidoreductase